MSRLKIILIFFLIIFVECTSNDTVYLGGGYTYYREQQDILGPIDIPPHILHYTFNDELILAVQNLKGFNPPAIYDKIEYHYNYGLNSNYYWIIDKRANKFYGPIVYDEFINTCDSLNISKELYRDFKNIKRSIHK